MKRIITSALLAILALPALATYWKGDVNGDGQVDMADMVAMAKVIKAGNADKTKYDLNASGRVDDADLHFLANLIIGGKLVEDSGLSVGIGGWDDTGEDFGGSVGAPPKKAGLANLQFYFSDPKYIPETSETYATMGIESADNMPCGILIDIWTGWGVEFDNPRFFELLLSSSVLDDHVLYGTPKLIGDLGDVLHLRFIVFSKDINSLKCIGELGNLFYSCNNGPYWTDIIISGQTISTDSHEAEEIEEQWITKQWQYNHVNSISDEVKIHADDNELHISGLNGGTRVTVCQPSGNVVHDAKADGDAMTVTLPSRCIYLITVGTHTHKIMI